MVDAGTEKGKRSTIQTITVAELPEGWNHQGETGQAICQTLGSAWFESGHATVLKVPSAVLPTESNHIVRANSGVLTQLSAEPLEFDPRLWPNRQRKARRPGPEKLRELLLTMLNRPPTEPK
jgi:hypothetical protein